MEEVKKEISEQIKSEVKSLAQAKKNSSVSRYQGTTTLSSITGIYKPSNFNTLTSIGGSLTARASKNASGAKDNKSKIRDSMIQNKITPSPSEANISKVNPISATPSVNGGSQMGKKPMLKRGFGSPKPPAALQTSRNHTKLTNLAETDPKVAKTEAKPEKPTQERKIPQKGVREAKIQINGKSSPKAKDRKPPVPKFGESIERPVIKSKPVNFVEANKTKVLKNGSPVRV